jgi:hypothetical protein
MTRAKNSGLLNHAREIRDRLFVDGRRLGLARLPDYRQVAAGQDCEEVRWHALTRSFWLRTRRMSHTDPALWLWPLVRRGDL